MHFLSSPYAILAFTTLSAVLQLNPSHSAITGVEAHSWMDCVNWVIKNPSKGLWTKDAGVCKGYARRFPKGSEFGSLDDANPSRHYQQKGPHPEKELPCSDHKHGQDVGADETKGDPVSSAYGGSKWGEMTVVQVGDELCVRWPAKNHAEKNEDNTVVQINLSKNKDGKDPTQLQLLENTVAKLSYKNCSSASTPDRRPCGGCFKVPVRASGVYLLQWRWMLNPGEWYTSCAVSQQKMK